MMTTTTILSKEKIVLGFYDFYWRHIRYDQVLLVMNKDPPISGEV
jgi:hypothetical protein